MSANIETLKNESKGDLVQMVSRMRSAAARHRVKERAKHGAKMLVGSTLAGVGGGVAAFLQVKFPNVPKTNIPSDLALGSALSAAAAINLFDGVDEQVNDFAKGLIGAGAAAMLRPIIAGHK